MPPADRETSTIILHDGEVGIHLRSKVPASMKSEVYQSEIVVTPTKILCCRCTCPCGSQTVERVVCVHNLPLLLNVSVFIGECLGEHLLLEMAACWNSEAWDKNGTSRAHPAQKLDVVDCPSEGELRHLQVMESSQSPKRQHHPL